MITLVIYFDSKEWDGPLSIHEMFSRQDAKVLALVPDYKVNLIAPAWIEVREDEEAIDVCLAIEQMNEEAAQKAAKAAAQKERISTLLESVKNIMANLGLSVEQAMDAIGVSELDRKKILLLI